MFLRVHDLPALVLWPDCGLAAERSRPRTPADCGERSKHRGGSYSVSGIELDMVCSRNVSGPLGTAGVQLRVGAEFMSRPIARFSYARVST